MGWTACATLSTDALLHNLAVIKKRAPYSAVMAMVKANAYGHGLRSVSLRLEPYVDYLGVARINEALALRRSGLKKSIAVMNGVSEQEEFLIASREDFCIVIHDPIQLVWLDKLVLPMPITVWLKIDTGMGRLGFRGDGARRAYAQLMKSASIVQPIGIMSHFACADTPLHVLNSEQLQAFHDFVHDKPGLKSLCNSAAIFSFPGCHYDVVRSGAALYGISPIMGVSAESLGLRPVMTLQTRLIAVKTVTRGSTIGYGAHYICPENMPIGIIAMGYGDGLSRTVGAGTPVLVNGIRCSLIGKVSMDMAMVDLRNCPDAQVGNSVILWGEGLPIEEAVRCSGLITYDTLTAVQFRVKFDWK